MKNNSIKEAQKQKDVFSKVFLQLSHLERAISWFTENSGLSVQLTILVKLDQSYLVDGIEMEERKADLKTYWKNLMGQEIEFGFFHNREIGTIFIAGPLSELFLHDIDGKKLGALSEGPYGIFRGLGISDAEANRYLKQLNEGHYLLLARGNELDYYTIDRMLDDLKSTG